MTFVIDENGILTVTAKDKGSGKKESITIADDNSRLTKEQIEKMIKESERNAKRDKEIRDRLEARSSFDNYVRSMKSTVDDSAPLA